ncbi:MAG: Fur family transcriptional regulator [Candidatus Marinarcus sp.]|uniref:Fur family transcriptional regulator n=1 Tax=Candidatus Marinarcus sp. TaxID=3100987 RepID=UPI003AFFD264
MSLKANVKNFNNSKNYKEFLNVVKQRLNHHKQLLTQNKKTILKILFESQSHLSAEEIIAISETYNDGLLSASTVYRTLSSFEHFGVVESLAIQDKKRYELNYLKQPHYHLYCQECNQVIEFEDAKIHSSFLSTIEKMNFKALHFNVIISGVCKQCLNSSK